MQVVEGKVSQSATRALTGLIHAAAAVPKDVLRPTGFQTVAELAACLSELADSAAEGPAAAAQLRQHALPPPARLAAALLDWWRRPEQQQQNALALAQAAAGRSCAYLRCANLGGEGGPEAGQGVGSMRCRCEGVGWMGGWMGAVRRLKCSGHCWSTLPCSPHPTLRSACRAVWYCGTACSHADWRQGGHRRVCKALGAARVAAKAARAAAPTAEAGTAAED